MYRIMMTALVLVAFSLPAAADLTLEYSDGDGERLTALYIKGDKLRMDTFGRSPNSVLFDANREELVIVERSRRRYTVIDRAAIETMRSQIEQAMQMVEQMGMSMDQLSQMIPGFNEPVTISYDRTGRTGSVDGRNCEIVEIMVNGEIESIACVATLDALGIGHGEMTTLKAMSEMLTAMVADIVPGDIMSLDVDGMEGIPLKTMDGAGRVEERLTGVDRGSLDASMFEVPDGFRRERLDFGG